MRKRSFILSGQCGRPSFASRLGLGQLAAGGGGGRGMPGYLSRTTLYGTLHKVQVLGDNSPRAH